MRVLILGGTTEAGALAAVLAGHAVYRTTVSLAGRTERPVLPTVETRIGGFGGPDGLAAWLQQNAIGALVDATHPFAARMGWNAFEACAKTGTPLLRFGRPAWSPEAGDRWIDVPDMDSAVAALGAEPRRVFLTVGRLSLPAFAAAPQHTYLVRTIDAPSDLGMLPRHRLLLARGPFDAAAEEALMRSEDVEMLVTKNSGGTATAGKLAAARALGLPVVMVRRPPQPEVAAAGSVAEVMDWLKAIHQGAHAPPP